MEFKLEYPTLESLAAIKVLINHWTDKNILTSMEVQSMAPEDYKARYHRLLELETVVKERVSFVFTPRFRKSRLSIYRKVVAMEIHSWRECHAELFSADFINKAVTKLCWTSMGTVDTLKTAICIVETESLDVGQRYILACIYCLEDSIHPLWRQLPEELQSYYFNNTSADFQENAQLHFWTFYNVSLDIGRRNADYDSVLFSSSIARQMFKIALRQCNVPAMKYFRKKMNAADTAHELNHLHRIISTWAPEQNSFQKSFSDSGIYLLRTINNSQRENLLRHCPVELLICFLKWPYQMFFLEISRMVRRRLDPEGFNTVSKHLWAVRYQGFKEFDYRDLFHKFWQESSDIHKSHLLDQIPNPPRVVWNSLIGLFDEETMRIIFESATELQKCRVFLSDYGVEICSYLSKKRQIKLLQLYRNCISALDQSILRNLGASGDEISKFLTNAKICHKSISIAYRYHEMHRVSNGSSDGSPRDSSCLRSCM